MVRYIKLDSIGVPDLPLRNQESPPKSVSFPGRCQIYLSFILNTGECDVSNFNDLKDKFIGVVKITYGHDPLGTGSSSMPPKDSIRNISDQLQS